MINDLDKGKYLMDKRYQRLIGATGLLTALAVGQSAMAGYYQPAKTYRLNGVGALQSLVADFNADGSEDVAVRFLRPGGLGSMINFLAGNGSTSMQIESSIALQAQLGWMVSGDFNGDGQTDIAAPIAKPAGASDPYCGRQDGVAVFYGLHNDIQPDLQFAACTPTPAGGRLVVFDANQDGLDDLIVGNQLYIGDGSGAFTAASPLPVGWKSVVDINGDHIPDVLTDSVAVCGDGSGAFSSCPVPPNAPQVRTDAQGHLARTVNGQPVGARYLAYGKNPKYVPAYDPSLQGSMPLSGLRQADVNGDGIDDLVGWVVTSQVNPSWDEWYYCPGPGYSHPADVVFPATARYSQQLAAQAVARQAFRAKYVYVLGSGLGDNYYVLRTTYDQAIANSTPITRALAAPLAQVRQDWNAAHGGAGTARSGVRITRPFRKARGGRRQGHRFYGSGYVSRPSVPKCFRYLDAPTPANHYFGYGPGQLGHRHVVLTNERVPEMSAIRVILINADGSTSQVTSAPVKGIFHKAGFVVTDVDGDGVPDVVADLDMVSYPGRGLGPVSGRGPGKAFFKGQGDGQFVDAGQLAAAYSDMGDFNGDGATDFGQAFPVAGSEDVYKIDFHVSMVSPQQVVPAPRPVIPPVTVNPPVVPAPVPQTTPPASSTGGGSAPATAQLTSVIESAGTVSAAGIGWFVVNGARITIDAVSALSFQDGFGPTIKVGDPIQFKAQGYSDGTAVLMAAEVG